MTSALPVRHRGQSQKVAMPVAWGHALEVTELLKVLADPTRLSMVLCLCEAGGPVCICDFTAAFHLGQPTISHHMARLKAAGLVESQRQGIWIYYRLRADLPPATEAVLRALLASTEPR